jgi:glycosyltransferase involved in cell wall biosynthesis
MAARIDVVYVITGLATGGAELMLLKLLRSLDRQRFVPHVVSLTTKGDVGPQIAALGIPVFSLQMRNAWTAFVALVRLWRLLRNLKPQLLHTWMYHADLLGGVAGRLAGVPRVIWGIRHTDLSPGANKRSTLAVATLCARLSHWVPDIITVNSGAARAVHVRHGYQASKMVLIPNGFELSQFAPDTSHRDAVRAELGISSDTPLVGVIGRFHAQKNQLGFLDAMAMLHRHRPDVHVLLAGAGVDAGNAHLESRVRERGLERVVHMLGQRRDVPRLLAALDMLALPSVGEAFPNVVGEAMSCEVPCAVVDVGDAAMIVGDTGRVVPPGDMAGLAQAMHDLLAMTGEERANLGRLARQRVASRFDIGAVTRQYEAQYDALVHVQGLDP